jgi:putative CocE/NonD family hydrolase
MRRRQFNGAYRIRVALFALAALLGSAWLFRTVLIDFTAQSLFLPTAETRPATHRVSTHRDVAMTTRDGVVLRAVVHRPIGLDKAPTILTRIPFSDTLWNRLRSDSIGRFWAARGYVVVVQGTRGRFRSGGEFVPLTYERDDGIDTLAWLRQQPWWEGRLAMWGGSAFGHTQWAIADQGDLGPNAYFVQIASSRFQDFFHPGGAFALESGLYWALNSHGPRDLDVDMAALDRGARSLPVNRADDAAAQDISFFNDWLKNQPGSAYWDGVDGEDRAAQARAPFLLLGGWYDPFLPSMLADFAKLSTAPASAQSHLIIGPYAHAREIAWPGLPTPVRYRRGSIEPALDWFDLRLKVGPPVKPNARVRLYIMGANAWRDEKEWPLARTRYVPLYLAPGGGLSDAAPDGTTVARYVSNPLNPVPTRGGAMLGPRAGVVAQDPAGARADVLSFVGPPLPGPMELVGPVQAALWVTTDSPSTDFTAKLSFVALDGVAYNLTDGIIRSAYTLGERAYIEIDMGATGVRLPAGARLRVDIASSNFPRFDRNPNTGESAASATTTRLAQQALWLGAETPSHVLLPVIPE